MSNYINNGAIWKRKDKNGNDYFSFKADRDIKKGESFLLFKNDRKTEEKHPDFSSSTKIEESVKPSVDETDKLIDEIPF